MGFVLTRSDWVTTMETFSSKGQQMFTLFGNLDLLFGVLSKNNCKAILAISNRAIEEQRIQLGKWVQQGYLQKSASQRIKGKIKFGASTPEGFG